MYEAFWELNARPFENTADTRFYYPGESHQAATLKLRYTIENRRGAAVLTGASGLGKTLLVQTLFQQLPDSVRPRVHIVYPQMPSDQLLSYLATELTGDGSSQSPTVQQSVRRIKDTVEQAAQDERHVVIAIDESHLLTQPETLEALRLLVNFEIEGRPALTLLLVGQTSLIPLLDRHRDLEERLAVKCLLRPFDQDETLGYVHHRLRQAGANEDVFTEGALELVHSLSRGNPRQINRLCDLALLVGYAEELTRLDESSIEAVADDLATVSPE